MIISLFSRVCRSRATDGSRRWALELFGRPGAGSKLSAPSRLTLQSRIYIPPSFFPSPTTTKRREPRMNDNYVTEFHDHQRAARAVIALLDGDRPALVAVLRDVAEASGNAPVGLIFACVELTVEVLRDASGGTEAAADRMRRALGTFTAEAIERGDLDE